MSFISAAMPLAANIPVSPLQPRGDQMMQDAAPSIPISMELSTPGVQLSQYNQQLGQAQGNLIVQQGNLTAQPWGNPPMGQAVILQPPQVHFATSFPTSYGPVVPFQARGHPSAPMDYDEPVQMVPVQQVQDLRQELFDLNDAAVQHAKAREAGFSRAEQTFIAHERDLAQAEVARGEAQVTARLRMTQSRELTIQRRELANQANYAMQQQEQALALRASDVLNTRLADQEKDLGTRAENVMAQRQQAIVYEAEDVMHQQQLAAHSQRADLELQAEQRMQWMWQQSLAETQQLQAQLAHHQGLTEQKNDASVQAEIKLQAVMQAEMQMQRQLHMQRDLTKHVQEQNELYRNSALQMQQQLKDTHNKTVKSHDSTLRENETLRQQIADMQLESKKAQERSQFRQDDMQRQLEYLQGILQAAGDTAPCQPCQWPISTPPETEPQQQDDEDDNYDINEEYDELENPDDNPEKDDQPGETRTSNAGGDSRGGETREENTTSKEERLPNYKEADDVNFPSWPSQRQLRSFKMSARKNIAGASGRPEDAFKCWAKSEFAKSIEELEDDEGYDSLSAKAAIGLHKKCHGEFKRQIEIIEEELALQDKMLNGRQLYWLILQELSRDKADGQITDLEDLLAVELKGDNLRAYQNEWKHTLLHLSEREKYTDLMLESLYHRQLKECPQFKKTMEAYKAEIIQHRAEKSYQTLFDMVENFLEGQRQERNRSSADSRHHGYAHATEQKTCKNGQCRKFFNTGRCTDVDCPWTHYNTLYPDGKGKGDKGKGKGKGKRGRSDGKGDKGGKGKGKGKGDRSQSQQPQQDRGRSREREEQQPRERRGTSPSGKPDQKACTWHLKGTCKNGATCDKWHSGPCRFWKKGECNLGGKCPFLHRPKNATPAKAEDEATAQPKPKAKPKAKGKKRAKAQAGVIMHREVTEEEKEAFIASQDSQSPLNQ